MHPVPIFGYILDGELTVDSGAKARHGPGHQRDGRSPLTENGACNDDQGECGASHPHYRLKLWPSRTGLGPKSNTTFCSNG
jgi:hypothetical protein